MTARETLEILDSAMAEMSYSERKKLWSILTALRGPDMMNGVSSRAIDRHKKAWTAVVRSFAFPKSKRCLPCMTVNQDSADSAGLRKKLATPVYRKRTALLKNNDHFYSHAMDAFRAFGIDPRRQVNIP